MIYLVSQFVPFLLLALGVGVVVGWLIWGGSDDEIREGFDAPEGTADTTHLQAQLRTHEGELTSARSRIQQLTAEHEGRALELAGARAAQDAAQSRVTELERTLSEAGSSDAGAPASVPVELQAVREERDAARAQVTELEAALAAVRSEGSLAAPAQLQALRTENDAAKARVSQLEAALAKAVDEIQTITAGDGDGPAELAGLRIGHERALTEIEQLRMERSRLQARLASGVSGDPGIALQQANRIAELERQLASERDLGRMEIERARFQLESARTASDHARSLAELAGRELERMRGELGRVDGDRKDLASRVAGTGSSDQLVKLQEQRDAAGAEADGLAARLREQRSILEARDIELVQVRRELDDVRIGARNELVATHAALDQHRTDTEQALANTSARSAAADLANVRLASEIALIRSSQESRVFELQRALSDCQLRYDSAQTELGRLAAELAVLRATSGLAGMPSSFAASYGASLFPPAGALPQASDSSRSAPRYPSPGYEAPYQPPPGYSPYVTPNPTPDPSGASAGSHGPSGFGTPPSSPNPDAAGSPDNLEEIIGIGPVLAKRLREFGVTTFRQIGEWDDAAIDRYQAQLSDFPDRIRRDNWVGGARQIWERRFGRAWAERALVDGTRP